MGVGMIRNGLVFLSSEIKPATQVYLLHMICTVYISHCKYNQCTYAMFVMVYDWRIDAWHKTGKMLCYIYCSTIWMPFIVETLRAHTCSCTLHVHYNKLGGRYSLLKIACLYLLGVYCTAVLYALGVDWNPYCKHQNFDPAKLNWSWTWTICNQAWTWSALTVNGICLMLRSQNIFPRNIWKLIIVVFIIDYNYVHTYRRSNLFVIVMHICYIRE